MSARLIGVDWGTTSLRCYLVDASGAVIDACQSADGILAVAEDGFGDVLHARIAPWLSRAPALPIVMSGMIGSRQGWVEAPYLHCPAKLSDFADALVPISHAGLPPISLVPGLDDHDGSGNPDVMRGEETQVFGALANLRIDDGLIVLPGTHSKWVTVQGGGIASFRTYMTGEVFSALKSHTILGRLIDGDVHDDDGFQRGVRSSDGASAGTLLHTIFSARSLALFGELAPTAVSSYLSGLLIGAEIRAASARAERGNIHVLARDDLAALYMTAFEILGISAQSIDDTCVVLGHLTLADCAGL